VQQCERPPPPAVCGVAQGELLLRCEELRDGLWALCDAKHEAAEAARLKLAADGSAAEHVALMGQQLTSLVQVELDRWAKQSTHCLDLSAGQDRVTHEQHPKHGTAVVHITANVDQSACAEQGSTALDTTAGADCQVVKNP